MWKGLKVRDDFVLAEWLRDFLTEAQKNNAISVNIPIDTFELIIKRIEVDDKLRKDIENQLAALKQLWT